VVTRDDGALFSLAGFGADNVGMYAEAVGSRDGAFVFSLGYSLPAGRAVGPASGHMVDRIVLEFSTGRMRSSLTVDDIVLRQEFAAVAAVPAPGALASFLLAIGGLAVARRRYFNPPAVNPRR